MDPDSSPPLPPHVRDERGRINATIDMGNMASKARVSNAEFHNSPSNLYGRRTTLYSNPASRGGKRRTKKKYGGKRHKKSKTSKKRGHKKSKTHKKRGHKKRA